jgi:hypothetical protein
LQIIKKIYEELVLKLKGEALEKALHNIRNAVLAHWLIISADYPPHLLEQNLRKVVPKKYTHGLQGNLTNPEDPQRPVLTYKEMQALRDAIGPSAHIHHQTPLIPVMFGPGQPHFVTNTALVSAHEGRGGLGGMYSHGHLR